MATPMRCYYEVLELERTCSFEEIKKQYRKLVLKWHPDKNIGNEEEATLRFKEITTAHTVLCNPQERKWYDDHRESILSGGDGTAGAGDGSDVVVNLWPYFNAMCFKGFNDGPGGFYAVYFNLFSGIADREAENGTTKSASSIPSFGSKESVPNEVISFYNHWGSFVTSLSFAWEDKYDVREAPNRIVKRAIEKENKKCRDEARRKYQDELRALVVFVRTLDPRMIKIESDRKLKKAEEDAMKEAKRAADLVAKKELRLRRQQQLEADEAELERREKERKGAYLLADNEDEWDAILAEEPRDSFQEPVEIVGLKVYNAVEISESESDEEAGEEEFIVLRCEICRKDFKSQSQMDQHLVSKNHKKKEAEATKKVGVKITQKDAKATVPTEDSILLSDKEDAPVLKSTISKKAQKKKNKKKQALLVEDILGEDSDDDGGVGHVAASATLRTGLLSKDLDSEEDSNEEQA